MMLILQFAFIGLLAGSAIAQSNAGLPSCAANGCVTSDYGGCEALDIECICTQGDWIAGLACCVSTACDAAGQEATIEFANAICGSVGKADLLPTTATCAASATATSASTAASSSSSSASGTATASSGSSSITAAPASSTTASSDSTTTNSASSGTATDSASTSSATTAGDSGANAYKAQGAGLVLGLVGFLAAL